MPISSSSLLTTRNFISHALPYLNLSSGVERFETVCALALCTSSSFMNGSLAPEILVMLQGSLTDHFDECRTHRHGEQWSNYCELISMIMIDFSSTLQFVNEIFISVSRLPHSGSLAGRFKLTAENFLFKMIFCTRYFVRQCESIRLNLPFTSSAIFETCLPQMAALRTLIIGETIYYHSVSTLIHPSALVPEAALVTALTAARNLDTLELNHHCTINMNDETLEKVWKMNKMPYLRSLRIGGSNFSPISDLSCISKYHRALTSLDINWTQFDRNDHSFTIYDDNKLILPNLAVMPDLRKFAFRSCELPEDSILDLLFSPSSSSSSSSQDGESRYYLKYLTSLTLVFQYGSCDRLLSFLEQFDGSLVRDLTARISWGSPSHYSDENIQQLTRKFPLLQELNLEESENLSNKFLQTIGENASSLRDITFPTTSTQTIDDKGMSYLFDPQKCSGGCFRTLRQLDFGNGGDHFNMEICGLNWFGRGLEDAEKNYQMNYLDLGLSYRFEAEGIAQICTAFSHCLEYLILNVDMEGSLSETTTKMPVMKQLTNLTFYHPVVETKDNCGVIIKNCIKLCHISFLTDVEEDGQPSNRDENEHYLQAFAENFVDGEDKMLNLEVFHYCPGGLAPGNYSPDSQLRIAKINSLKQVKYAKDKKDWSVLLEARPDIQVL